MLARQHTCCFPWYSEVGLLTLMSVMFSKMKFDKVYHQLHYIFSKCIVSKWPTDIWGKEKFPVYPGF